MIYLTSKPRQNKNIYACIKFNAENTEAISILIKPTNLN